MKENLIFHTWFVIGFFHMIYLSVKMLPHFKRGYEHYFWLGFWLYKPDSLDDKGKKIRIYMIVSMIVYFSVGTILARYQ